MSPYVYVVSFFVLAIYGIVATSIGAYSAAHPCNMNTQALVLSCEAGPKLGDTYFHIQYSDYLGAVHNATIVSDRFQCAQAKQTLDLCYLKNNPEVFKNDKAFLKDPVAGPALLWTGVSCLSITVIVIVAALCIADRLRPYERASSAIPLGLLAGMAISTTTTYQAPSWSPV